MSFIMYVRRVLPSPLALTPQTRWRWDAQTRCAPFGRACSQVSISIISAPPQQRWPSASLLRLWICNPSRNLGETPDFEILAELDLVAAMLADERV